MDTVPEIKLYAGYSVSIEASVSEEDITKESAIIKGNTAGTTVYYTNKSAYQIYTGEELRNAAKSRGRWYIFNSTHRPRSAEEIYLLFSRRKFQYGCF